LRIRPAKPEDLPEIIALTEKTFATYFGRYHSDPKMPPGTGTKVYDEWVRSSFGGWADWILVAETDDRIAGYTMWKKPSVLELNHSLDIAHCNFGGIHPDFFGRGLYTALKLDAMRMARNFATHFDQLTHVSNFPVHRGILSLGWKITGARRSFHKWLQK
jgi:ribosomal protein S18 acetylase RimI-like enzyme